MKRIIIILSCLFFFGALKAQYIVPRGLPYKDTRFVNFAAPQGFVLFDSVIMFKNIADTQMKPLYPALGYLQNFAGDSTFWVWDMVRWKKIVSSGSSGTIPTWQQTLDVTNGNILTHDNSIFGNTYDLSFVNHYLTLLSDTIITPNLANGLANNLFFTTDVNGNVVLATPEVIPDSSGFIGTQTWQSTLNYGSDLNRNNFVNGLFNNFIWVHNNIWDVQAGHLQDTGAYSEVRIDTLSAFLYSQDTLQAKGSEVFVQPDNGRIVSFNNTLGDSAQVIVYNTGSATMAGNISDTLDAPIINFPHFHNADTSLNQINIDQNGNLYYTIKSSGITAITATPNYGFHPFANTSGSTTNIQVTSDLTLGSVPFIGTNGALRQNNSNFFWDSTNARLGISTNTPQVNLQVGNPVFAVIAQNRIRVATEGIILASNNGTNLNSGMLSLTANDAANAYSFNSGRRARNTVTSPTATQNGDTLYVVGGGGYDGSDWTLRNTADLALVSSGNYTTSSTPAYIAFEVTNTGEAVKREAVDILSNRDVIIRNLQSDTTAPAQSGTSKMVITDQDGRLSFQTIPAGGSVSSVALAAPSIFTVTGSPVTSTGTLTFASNNAQGDLIYGSATNTLAYLNKSSNLYQWLSNAGTSKNPSWQPIDTVGIIDVAGYILSGNFADTTTAINQAIIDASTTAKKTVRFSTAASPYVVSTHYRIGSSSTSHQGIQLLSQITVIIDNGVIIYADTAWTATTSNANFYPLFNGYQVSNVTIDGNGGSVLDGQRTTFGNYTTNPETNPSGYYSDTAKRWSTSLIQFFYGDNNKVRNVYGKNGQFNGVLGMFTSNLFIGNSVFSKNGGSGIGLMRATTGNFVYNIADSNNSDQLRMDSCIVGDIHFAYCKGSNAQASSAATNWFAGIYIAGSSHVHVDHCLFYNNSAYGYDNASDTTSYKDNTITDSWLEYNRNAGIITTGYLTITDNWFINNGKDVGGTTDTKSGSGYNPAAISVTNATYLNIANNYSIDTVSNGNWAQIWFIKNSSGSAGFYRSNITGNIVKGVADTAHFRNGNIGGNNFMNNQTFTNANAIVIDAPNGFVQTYRTTDATTYLAVVPAGTPTLTATQVAYGDGSNLMTSDANFTRTANAQVTVNYSSVGTSAWKPALVLMDTTAAANNAQQYSPSLEFEGHFWNSAASTVQKYKIQLQTAQTNGGNLVISSTTGTNNWTDAINITPSGVINTNLGGTGNGYQGAFASIGGGTISTSQTLSIAKSGGASSTTYNAGISMNVQLANTAASTAAGILLNNVTMNTNPNAAGNFYGIESLLLLSAAVTTSPALVGGIHSELDFGINGAGVAFTKGAATYTHFNLHTGITKNLTTAYGEWIATTTTDANPTGKAVYYAGLRVDSIDQNITFSKPFGIDVRGTNGYSFIANSTLIGNYHASGNDTATSTLDVNGSFSAAYVAKTGNYTVTASDYTIEVTANSPTITLPTAVGVTGRIYNISNSGAGTITIATTSSQTFINVSGTPTTLTLATLGNYQVQSNGANWLVL